MKPAGLVSLGARPHRDGLVDRLLECHERIRTFSQLAMTLAAADAATEAVSVAGVAEQLHRYFTVALPLHVADEEESLQPRLLLQGSGALRAALATMQREHVDCDRLLVPLAAAWQRQRAGEAGLEACAGTAAGAQALAALMEAHLRLEEQVLFPAAARLPAETQAAIVAEMRARRQPPR